MLGHELRNPLGAISNAPTADAGRVRGGDTTRAATSSRPGPAPGGLVDDLLDVSRVVAGKVVLRLQPVELAETTRRVAALHGGPAAAPRDQVEATPVWVSATDSLEQVLTNLLATPSSNAGGRRIVVSVHPEGQHACSACATAA